MLFAVIYNGKSETEDAEKRSLDIFKNWTPPSGFELKSHWGLCRHRRWRGDRRG